MDRGTAIDGPGEWQEYETQDDEQGCGVDPYTEG
jgi:hypothetical protein